MISMVIDHNTTLDMCGSNVMTINYQSTTNLRSATKTTDFHAENTEESTAVLLIISQMIYHHITRQPMVITRQINCFLLKLAVKSILHTITSHNGLMKLGILATIHAEIQMQFLPLQEFCLLSG